MQCWILNHMPTQEKQGWVCSSSFQNTFFRTPTQKGARFVQLWKCWYVDMDDTSCTVRDSKEMLHWINMNNSEHHDVRVILSLKRLIHCIHLSKVIYMYMHLLYDNDVILRYTGTTECRYPSSNIGADRPLF